MEVYPQLEPKVMKIMQVNSILSCCYCMLLAKGHEKSQGSREINYHFANKELALKKVPYLL